MGIICWILILWTWGLTPLWVNVTCTVLMGIGWLLKIILNHLGIKIGKEIVKKYYDED